MNARAPGSSRLGPQGPDGVTVDPAMRPCPGCDRGVDALRAGHVAILNGAFFYFCGAECKRAYLTDHRGAEENVLTASPPEVSSAGIEELGPPANQGRPITVVPTRNAEPRFPDPRPERPPSRGQSIPDERPRSDFAASRAATPSGRPESARPSPLARRRDVFAAVDATGIVCGVLVPAIGLLGSVADFARGPLVVAAFAALVVRVFKEPRDAGDPHPMVVLAPAAGAVAAAGWATAIHDSRTVALAVFAALACATGVVVEILVGRARVRVHAARQRIERALDVSVRTIRAGDRVSLPAADLRPGEPVVVEPGEIVGVDATVTAGEARVVPWLGAKFEIVRREGDHVLAGARVVSSPLRMTATCSGRDRAWVKLLSSRATRIDVASPTTSAVRHTVERGAPLAAFLVGIASVAANSPAIEVLAAMCAGAMAFASKATCSMVALHFSRAHIDALARGILYKDARAFERAAAAGLAVLSARGTVLLGEPEIVAIEPVGALDVEKILSLAAGAEAVDRQPFAAAVLGAARMRGVEPDHVRNATAVAGMGVTAMASSGERLVVGGRAIMLEERVGVAVVEARVLELEAKGRSVLLVALGDRLVGIVALQDGLRAGARAAVQKLLDAHIEPVLLCGEARDTCETIGRSLDIEHVRPEVLPADRAAEVRALAEGGHVVAVIGHPAGDDGALGAADVAVAMGTAGSVPGDWGVVVAGDDVRDAALSLAIPREARDRARVAILLGASPGLLALLAIAFGVAPLALVPIAVLIGAVAVAVHGREAMTSSGSIGS